ncbi:hypothetical protein BDW74DRAFT_162361 [Aspergillus multicolor]|uniref:uncharacterized protein n=1 Tax=Aspergillus multicolor TaxID=41759 RepID=UPI003CCDB7B4
MQRRLQDAELNCDRLATSLAEFRNKAVQSDLHVTHPLLFQSLRDLVTLAEAAQGTDTDQQACQGGLEPKQRTHVDAPAKPSQNATSSFGYIVGCIADVSPGSHDDDHGPSP